MKVLNDKPELWPYVLISLIIHALFFVVFPKTISPPKFDDEKPIEVFSVPPQEPEKGREPARIADIAEPAVQQKPKSPSFLGMYDSAVPEELVGTDRRPGKSGEKSKFRKEVGGESRKAPKPTPAKRDLFAFNKSLFEEKKPVVEDEGAKSPGGEAGALDDFYPDFRRGPHTYLNVLRYPGVEYFVRLKRAFKTTFNPEPSLRDYFTRNQVARGSIDVVLAVSVGRSGDLSELFVFRSSGIPSYDQEALRTVRASAPFATPPEKFLADDGVLRMSWTFSVYL